MNKEMISYKFLKLLFFVVAILVVLITYIPKSEANTPEIKAGVRQFQTYINNNLPIQYLGSYLAVDGICGDLTKVAAVKLLQYRLNIDYLTNLDIDGQFGPESQVAYNEYKKTIERYQVNSPYVYILQGLLYSHDYDPNGFDGSYGFGGGVGCLNAVNNYKLNNNIDEFPNQSIGAVGVETMASLCWKPYRLEELEDGIYFIKNCCSNYYMTAQNGGETNMTNVVQMKYSTHKYKKWYVKKLNDGYYSIRPYHNLNFALDLYNNSGTSNIDIYNADRVNVQGYAKWKIVRVGKVQSSSNDIPYKILPKDFIDTCAAVTNGYTY